MHVKAKKTLGQNWLINPHIIDKIIAAAEITKSDTILEIGPGTGNLTKKLAEQTGKVIGIEKDHRLIEPLREAYKDYANVEIIEEDVLKLPTTTFQFPKDYKVVANIPYYITSHLLRTIFEEWPAPKLIVLTIQKEVAQRIIAKPPHMNLLALSMQYYSEPEVIVYISKNNFRPIPKVDSAIIKFVPKTSGRDSQLFNLLKIGFSEKRKQLASTLAKGLKLKKENIAEILTKIGSRPDIRPENLTLDQWIQLKKYLNI